MSEQDLQELNAREGQILLTTDCEFCQLVDFDGTRLNVFRFLGESDKGQELRTSVSRGEGDSAVLVHGFFLADPVTGEKVWVYKVREEGLQSYIFEGQEISLYRYYVYEPSPEQKAIRPEIANLVVVIDHASFSDLFGRLYTITVDSDGNPDYLNAKILREPMNQHERDIVANIRWFQARAATRLDAQHAENGATTAARAPAPSRALGLPGRSHRKRHGTN